MLDKPVVQPSVVGISIGSDYTVVTVQSQRKMLKLDECAPLRPRTHSIAILPSLENAATSCCRGYSLGTRGVRWLPQAERHLSFLFARRIMSRLVFLFSLRAPFPGITEKDTFQMASHDRELFRRRGGGDHSTYAEV